MLIELSYLEMTPHPVLSIVAAAGGGYTGMKRLRQGFYQIGHFGGTVFLPNFDHYPEFDNFDAGAIEVSRGSNGVCDNADQILSLYPELESSDRQFVVTMTEVRRDAQESNDGWRWHKWGSYIGSQNPENEYLYDDKHIDAVFCFHIYEKKNP